MDTKILGFAPIVCGVLRCDRDRAPHTNRSSTRVPTEHLLNLWRLENKQDSVFLIAILEQRTYNAFYRHLLSRSATGAVINGTGPDGCLPELDMFPLLQVMCLWYMCFCAEVFFFCSQTVLQMEHSLGKKIFFPPLFPHVNAVFFLHSLSSCSVYPIVICMLCMYGQVDG